MGMYLYAYVSVPVYAKESEGKKDRGVPESDKRENTLERV